MSNIAKTLKQEIAELRFKQHLESLPDGVPCNDNMCLIIRPCPTCGRTDAVRKVAPLTIAERHVLGFLDKKNGQHAGSFTNKLIDAMFSADVVNVRILKQAYPELMDAVLAWTIGDLAERSGNLGNFPNNEGG